MWSICASDTILQWAVPLTCMTNAKVFDIWGEVWTFQRLSVLWSAFPTLGLPRVSSNAASSCLFSALGCLFPISHSSLMMYTSVSGAFLSCLLFLAVIDTEACVIKTHQSLHYSTLICTELSSLSVNLFLI